MSRRVSVWANKPLQAPPNKAAHNYSVSPEQAERDRIRESNRRHLEALVRSLSLDGWTAAEIIEKVEEAYAAPVADSLASAAARNAFHRELNRRTEAAIDSLLWDADAESKAEDDQRADNAEGEE